MQTDRQREDGAEAPRASPELLAAQLPQEALPASETGSPQAFSSPTEGDEWLHSQPAEATHSDPLPQRQPVDKQSDLLTSGLAQLISTDPSKQWRRPSCPTPTGTRHWWSSSTGP